MSEQPRHKISISPQLIDATNGGDDSIVVTLSIEKNANQPEKRKQREKTVKSPWTKDK